MAGIVSSLRYLLADFIGEQAGKPPDLPDRLPASAAAIVQDAIHLLTEYQSADYAQLYVERLTRFAGRRGVDEAMFGEIARLMAARMSYEDPIRIAQLRLAEFADDAGGLRGKGGAEIRTFRLDELIGALPAAVAEPLLDMLDWLGWLQRPVRVRFSTNSRWGVARLRIEAAMRRWRRLSVRYAKERAWVERWLHMVSRSLEKQPGAASAIVHTANMIGGSGDRYRQALADWHAMIDGLVKPTFDGELPLMDLAGALAEARAAALREPRQAELMRTIAEIRTRAMAASADARVG